MPIAGPGRPKGARNKLTATAKEAIETAFESIGGIEALSAWAKENPRDFYPIWAKLLPKDMTIEQKGPLEVVVRFAAEGRKSTAS